MKINIALTDNSTAVKFYINGKPADPKIILWMLSNGISKIVYLNGRYEIEVEQEEITERIL